MRPEGLPSDTVLIGCKLDGSSKEPGITLYADLVEHPQNMPSSALAMPAAASRAAQSHNFRLSLISFPFSRALQPPQSYFLGHLRQPELSRPFAVRCCH